MRFEGEQSIEASRARAWAFLTDPHRIVGCAPEVQSLKIVDDQRFLVAVRAGVGPIKATFTFAVMWHERQAPERARIQARGRLPASTIEMLTVMTLTEQGEQRSRLRWESDVQITGLLGGLGQPLIQDAADAVLKRVFACVNTKLRAEPVGPDSAPGTAPG